MNIKVDSYRKMHIPKLQNFVKKAVHLKTDMAKIQAYASLNAMSIIVVMCLYSEVYGITEEIRKNILSLKKFYSIDNIISSVDFGV